MLKIKEWWNDFKQDLFFNITMTIMCFMLYVLVILMFIICFKDWIGIILIFGIFLWLIVKGGDVDDE